MSPEKDAEALRKQTVTITPAEASLHFLQSLTNLFKQSVMHLEEVKRNLKMEPGHFYLISFFFFFFWRWEVKLCDRKYIFKIVLFLIAGKKKSFLDYFLFILEENKYQLGANFLLIRA